MKDKFFKMSLQKAIAELEQITEDKQKERSYNTGFGIGFPRWVASIDLIQHLNNNFCPSYQFTFADIRTIYKELANRKLIEIKQSRSYGMLEYSVINWIGYQPIGDYFIKLND